LRQLSIVVGGYRPLEPFSKRHRREQLGPRQGLGIDSSLGRQRVPDLQVYSGSVLPEDDVRDGFRANIAARAVADAVRCRKGCIRNGRATAVAVTEPQVSATIVVDFDDEVAALAVAVKQIRLWFPGCRMRLC
jgi:hypothetical protein